MFAHGGARQAQWACMHRQEQGVKGTDCWPTKQPGDQMTKGGVHRGLAMALVDDAVDKCGDPRAAALQL